MKITVQRSGGMAGIQRTWTVRPEPPEDTDRWQPLIEACPWDAVAGSGLLERRHVLRADDPARSGAILHETNAARSCPSVN